MRRIYVEWYQLLKKWLPEEARVVIELGSGPGFISQEIPNAITSDILYLPYLDMVMNGRHLPFCKQCLDALLMVDVFHHISDAGSFLDEVSRVLKAGGRLVMIEPWLTSWSKWVLTRFHHEPMDFNAVEWAFSSDGPLTGANQALPWIVFNRDSILFSEKFPDLRVMLIQPIMPLTYILGGGFSHRFSFPGFTYPFFSTIDRRLMDPERRGMFALIVAEKIK